MAKKPTAYELWVKAGGGTDHYDRDEYLKLMQENGLLVPALPDDTDGKGFRHLRPLRSLKRRRRRLR